MMSYPQRRRLARYFRVFIEDQIAQRKYDYPIQVIEDGLRVLEAREAKLDRLDEALEAGIASGEAVEFDMDEWLAKQDRVDSTD